MVPVVLVAAALAGWTGFIVGRAEARLEFRPRLRAALERKSRQASRRYGRAGWARLAAAAARRAAVAGGR